MAFGPCFDCENEFRGEQFATVSLQKDFNVHLSPKKFVILDAKNLTN